MPKLVTIFLAENITTFDFVSIVRVNESSSNNDFINLTMF